MTAKFLSFHIMNVLAEKSIVLIIHVGQVYIIIKLKVQLFYYLISLALTKNDDKVFYHNFLSDNIHFYKNWKL